MPDLHIILIVILVILAVCLVFAILFRLIRIAVVVVGLIILVPILCTIMWGDGTGYVSKFASIFSPEIEESINDGYETYRDQNAEDPIVDMDQMDDWFETAGDTIENAFDRPVFPPR
ncbi:hypothetical protein [uncultured Flavonifractor sp.]|uniref:hypothetical protein n=1 Tax=uncultured Flavonifractor sp. TaxID=1193534 RepID=UPI002599368C|nr:hypothetical protein [uncultured Flavonifractor sp.]